MASGRIQSSNLFLFFVLLICAICSVARASSEGKNNFAQTVQSQAPEGSEDGGDDGGKGNESSHSPFTFLQPKLTCWECTAPCRGRYCCNDNYPQCCAINGVCRCCRR